MAAPENPGVGPKRPASRIDEVRRPDAPVRWIPGDPPRDRPRKGMALCLSGGGYRAMLFHTGTLWRLNELGQLPRLDQVSSVSGGSITAGVLAMNWSRLAFDADGVAPTFVEQVVEPIRRMAGVTIDIPSILEGFVSLGLAGSRTAGEYQRHLFGHTVMTDLPARPNFVFNATNLASGVLWRFTREAMRDYRVGEVARVKTELATAVAASSAFPPFLSPLRLKFKPSDFTPGSGQDLQQPPYTTDVRLTDGGVYDNLGLETSWKRYQTILCSDGGALAPPDPSPHLDWALQVVRVLMLIDSQVTVLRKRQLIDSYENRLRDGSYFGIASDIASYRVSKPLPCPYDQTLELAKVATRLDAMPERTQEALINWGYAITDAGMRKHVMPSARPGRFPYPDVGVDLDG